MHPSSTLDPKTPQARPSLAIVRAARSIALGLWRGCSGGRIQGSDLSTQEFAAQQFGARIDEASRLWTTHLGMAQSQMREATDQLLQGFAQILEQLDAIIAPDGAAGHAADGTSSLDQRAAILEQCELRLRGLIENFQGFVQSREEVLGAVHSLTSASTSLRDMAEDVAKLARQTHLLSINAAIEAARAGPSGRGFAVVATEVRRLSSESGDTGKRISEQVNGFSNRMRQALQQADHHSEQDTRVIQASELTIGEVIEQVDAAVSNPFKLSLLILRRISLMPSFLTP